MTHTQSEDNMTGGWKTVKLGEIADYVREKVRISQLDESTYVSTENMLPNKGGIVPASTLPTGTLTQAFKCGDVLVSNIRPYFKKIWFATFDGGCSADVLVFRAKSGIDSSFLRYALSNDSFFAHSMASSKGTKMPRGDKQSIMRYEVPDVPLDVQRRIAAVLKPLDDKIELNARINARLERAAQALFKRHFVRFEREKRPFSSLIQICGGGTPKTDVKEYWNGDIPFFTPKDANNTFTFKTEKSVTQLGIEHCNSPLYPANTTFITARGTVGKVSMAGIPMAMNQSCYALTSDVLDPILVYFYAQEIVKSLRKKASGAVFDAIVTRDFSSETISMLSDAEANEILSAIKPLMNAIHLNLRQSRTLARLRDVLLPRLMSGAVDVRQVRLNTMQEGGSR